MGNREQSTEGLHVKPSGERIISGGESYGKQVRDHMLGSGGSYVKQWGTVSSAVETVCKAVGLYSKHQGGLVLSSGGPCAKQWRTMC